MTNVDPVRHFGAMMAQAQDDLFEPRRAARRAAFLMEASQRSRQRERVVWVYWTAVPLAAAAALAAVVWSGAVPLAGEAPHTLAPMVSQAPAALEATGEAPTLPDVDHIELSPQAVASMTTSTDRSGRLVLERGSATFDRDPESIAWTIAAGPYRIQVAGSAVAVDWQPETETIVIELDEGRVEVTAEGMKTRVLESGERLQLGGKQKATRKGRRRKGASEPAPTWKTHAEAGEYKAALELAKRQGFTKLCTQLPAGELLELADVARFAGARHDADEALLALRRRFPGSRQAAKAAFDLARVHARDCGKVQQWLETYLGEQPNGNMRRSAERRLAECRGTPAD